MNRIDFLKKTIITGVAAMATPFVLKAKKVQANKCLNFFNFIKS